MTTSNRPNRSEPGKPQKSKPLGSFMTPPEVPDAARRMFAGLAIAEKQATKQTQYCATPGCTAKKFQDCHVIAEASQIRPIAEDGLVCWIPMKSGSRWSVKPFFEEVGVSNVLVFRGFCNSCDSSIFKKIDEPLALDEETYRLLAYRSVGYGLWRAKVDLRTTELLPDKMLSPTKKKLPSSARHDLKDGLAPTLRKQQTEKNLLDDLAEGLRPGGANGVKLETAVFDFGQSLPVRFSVVANFTRDLRHRYSEITLAECPQKPAVFLHVLEQGGSTKLILSWPEYVPARFPRRWIKSLKRWSKRGQLADVLWRYMFLNNHGLAFTPSAVVPWSVEQHVFLVKHLANQMYAFEDVPIEVTRLRRPPLFKSDNWGLSRIQ